jgi:hypothetical protein
MSSKSSSLSPSSLLVLKLLLTFIDLFNVLALQSALFVHHTTDLFIRLPNKCIFMSTSSFPSTTTISVIDSYNDGDSYDYDYDDVIMKPMSNHNVVMNNELNSIAHNIIDECSVNGYHLDHSIQLGADDIITVNELIPLLSVQQCHDINQCTHMHFNHSWLPLLLDMQDMIQIMQDKSKQLLSLSLPSSSLSSSSSSSSPSSYTKRGHDVDDDYVNGDRVISSPTITCRLAIVHGVRCSKWHEDNVYMRLIKSYYGPGADWIHPSHTIVRLENYFRGLCDMDLSVRYPMWIQHAKCLDILIINGKKRRTKKWPLHGIKEGPLHGIKEGIKGWTSGEDYQSLPVLHRSPVVDLKSKRLLYTVTIDIDHD